MLLLFLMMLIKCIYIFYLKHSFVEERRLPDTMCPVPVKENNLIKFYILKPFTSNNINNMLYIKVYIIFDRYIKYNIRQNFYLPNLSHYHLRLNHAMYKQKRCYITATG